MGRTLYLRVKNLQTCVCLAQKREVDPAPWSGFPRAVESLRRLMIVKEKVSRNQVAEAMHFVTLAVC